ncbi:hypothetical protein LTR97_009552 [Elasticomyces elasticus]|uniref:Uncharacterized protein n=1 Tax=Elasticomyces elasticus TaxID=574655 RepID=A0AAN7VZ94_9PEZI|nr:hypothetical protein LTR97_009552 [Elasticomyces elasticus]
MELPRIDFDLRDHKLSIAVTWTVLFLSSGALPVILYFTLRYGTDLELDTVLGIPTAILGVVSLASLLVRSWALLKNNSACRPLNGSRWALDYFHWNFLIAFTVITALVTAGTVIPSIRLVAIGLPILLVSVGTQLLLAAALVYTRTAAPFTISSVREGQPVRSGVYAITEDIVAVDGGQGQAFRQQLEARYLASRTIRGLFHRLDLVWGVSAVVVGALSTGLLFGLESQDAGYVLGWMIPWVYAAAMVGVTRYMVKSVLKSEEKDPALQ